MWALRLQQYDFEIIYRSGKKHQDADFFSRNPVDQPNPFEDPLIPNIMLCQLQLKDYADEFLCFSAVEKDQIRRLQYSDKHYKPLIKQVLNRPNQPSDSCQLDQKSADFFLHDGILYKANVCESGRPWLLCIPAKMRGKILAEIHVDTLNHLGLFKTYALLRSRYFWPKMYVHCSRYVRSCHICQMYNRRNFNVPGPLLPVAPPTLPFFRVGIDFQGPFQLTSRFKNQYVFTVVDHLTRFVEAWPTKSCDAASAIAVLEKHVIFRHGCPREILADRGSSFTSKIFRQFCEKYQIKLLFTAAYKPDTNGVCERQNDVLKIIISKKVNESHTNWDQFVPIAVWSINISTHRINNESPYKLLYGRDPFLACDSSKPFF